LFHKVLENAETPRRGEEKGYFDPDFFG